MISMCDVNLVFRKPVCILPCSCTLLYIAPGFKALQGLQKLILYLIYTLPEAGLMFSDCMFQFRFQVERLHNSEALNMTVKQP